MLDIYEALLTAKRNEDDSFKLMRDNLQTYECEIKRAVEFGFITDELKMIAQGMPIPITTNNQETSCLNQD